MFSGAWLDRNEGGYRTVWGVYSIYPEIWNTLSQLLTPPAFPLGDAHFEITGSTSCGVFFSYKVWATIPPPSYTILCSEAPHPAMDPPSEIKLESVTITQSSTWYLAP